MSIIFDGKKKAEEILLKIKKKIQIKGLHPKLVSFYKPEDPGSALYTKIKSKKAKEVEIEFVGVPIQSIEETIQLIKQASGDLSVHGILVQHPQGGVYSNEQWQKFVSAIAPEKDVDGLRDDSQFLPATVKAILYILEEAQVDFCCSTFAVIGSEGMVGKKLVKVLKGMEAEVLEIDQDDIEAFCANIEKREIKKADVVISVTGMPGVIKAEMIKKGAVVIDVGAPKGDIDFEEVLQKASFITPVPGGVGPMTVACLLENVVEYKHRTP